MQLQSSTQNISGFIKDIQDETFKQIKNQAYINGKSPQQNDINDVQQHIGLIYCSNGKQKQFGTGTLITPKIVLTCAHTFYVTEGDKKIFSGRTFIEEDVCFCPGLKDRNQEDIKQGKPKKLAIEKIVIHPQYDYNFKKKISQKSDSKQHNKYDIALLFLKQQQKEKKFFKIAVNEYQKQEQQIPEVLRNQTSLIVGYDHHKWSMNDNHKFFQYKSFGSITKRDKNFIRHTISTQTGHSGSVVLVDLCLSQKNNQEKKYLDYVIYGIHTSHPFVGNNKAQYNLGLFISEEFFRWMCQSQEKFCGGSQRVLNLRVQKMNQPTNFYHNIKIFLQTFQKNTQKNIPSNILKDYYQIGQKYTQIGKYTQALQIFTKLKQTIKNYRSLTYSNITFKMSTILYQLKRYQESLIYINYAQSLYQYFNDCQREIEMSRLWRGLIMVCGGIGQRGELEAIAKGARRGPVQGCGVKGIFQFYYFRGLVGKNKEEAIWSLKEGIKRISSSRASSYHAYLYFQLGKQEYLSKNTKRAIQNFDKSCEIFKNIDLLDHPWHIQCRQYISKIEK